MKQKLLGFKKVENKSLIEQLDEFNKSVDDIENLEVKLEDDHKALMLLSSLPKSLENFKGTLLFGKKDQLSFEEIQTTLKTKFLQMKNDKRSQTPGEGLNDKFEKNKKQTQKKKQGRVTIKLKVIRIVELDMLKSENALVATR